MLFSSIPFLYLFLPLCLLFYHLAPRRFRNAVLLSSSLVFYAFGEPKYLLLMAIAVSVGYLSALLLERWSGTRRGKAILMLTIDAFVGLLAYFKYADFLIASFNAATGASIPLIRAALPIGISFYTFQLISYTVDVFCGNVKAQKSLLAFAMYVTMFPQLIAGPIVRYADVSDQLSTRRVTVADAAYGIRRFVTGLSKKVLFSNVLGELCKTFRASDEKSVLYYWLYAVAFTLHIYYDFSGYSDMAIGLGRLFGFRYPENFAYPYASANITEFWRRWHMSLGTWFRDYVYIPLGGNRKGKKRLLLNILVVWLLTGLWHGAAWNFLLWGFYFAVLLIMEKLWLLPRLAKMGIGKHLYTMGLVSVSFVIFNAASVKEAVSDIGGLFGAGRLPLLTAESVYSLRSYGVILLLGAVLATPFLRNAVGLVQKRGWGRTMLAIGEPLSLFALFAVSTAYLADGSFNPFLYFRF